MKAIQRYEVYEGHNLDQVLLDIKTGKLQAGRYASLVKIKPGANQKTRKEIFRGHTYSEDSEDE
jgi:hypothetical protein